METGISVVTVRRQEVSRCGQSWEFVYARFSLELLYLIMRVLEGCLCEDNFVKLIFISSRFKLGQFLNQKQVFNSLWFFFKF